MKTSILRTSLPLLIIIVASTGLALGQSSSPNPRLRPIQQNRKWGYIDSAGRIVIKLQFDWAEEFSEGLAAVSVDFEWGYIDRTGKWVIAPQFSVGRPFSDGLALVGVPVNGKVGFPPGPVKHVFIDKTGKVVIDPKDDILNGTFSEGAGTVQFITNHGVNAVLIDKTGKVIVNVQDIETDGFSEGLVPAKQSGKWPFRDRASVRWSASLLGRIGRHIDW